MPCHHALPPCLAGNSLAGDGALMGSAKKMRTTQQPKIPFAREIHEGSSGPAWPDAAPPADSAGPSKSSECRPQHFGAPGKGTCPIVVTTSAYLLGL